MSRTHSARTISRRALGGFLASMGAFHLVSPASFRGAIPDWVPGSKDMTSFASGLAEAAIGAGLLSGRHPKAFGRLAALLFMAVFPGNIEQYDKGIDAPVILDTDAKRRNRLLLQPAFVAWALETTRAD